MFGDDGWCRGCGIPKGDQSGPLILETADFQGSAEGAWVPHWHYEVVCCGRQLADELSARYGVRRRDVAWHGKGHGDVSQLIPEPAATAWFDHAELAETLKTEHGVAGASCDECGKWRWMPLGFSPVPPMTEHVLPPLVAPPDLDAHAVVASREWFGDGLKSFQLLLVREDVAKDVARASPQDFLVTLPRIAA